MGKRQLTAGTVSEHRKPGFIEFQFIKKFDYNKNISSPGTSVWFIPVISYEVDGEVYYYDTKTAYRGYKYLDIGESVQISYDPQNPKKCKLILNGSKSRRTDL